MPISGMPSSVKALGPARPSGTSMGPQARCCLPAALQRRLPILAWLPNYSLQWLKMDFIAGLSVGLTVIPQALAYAEVAGLPPQVRCLPPLPATSPSQGRTPLQASRPEAGYKCIVSSPGKRRTQSSSPVRPKKPYFMSGACDCLWADTPL